MNIFFGISLTAAFLAGVLALMAPCCITFLFPAYLGTIFKERQKVIYYTLVFGLGIGVILVPVALGFRFFIGFFDSNHSLVYYLGALVMILMGIMTLKPFIKLPMVNLNTNIKGQVNTFSVFTLGIFSGITSACCAPVLIAALTLTSLSPSLFSAFLVSIAYVFGIVFPLFLFSLFYEKLSDSFIGKNRQKTYDFFKTIGASIFILTGVLIAIFNYFGKIQMYQMESYSNMVRNIINSVSVNFKNPVVDILTFSLAVIAFVYLLNKNKAAKVSENEK